MIAPPLTEGPLTVEELQLAARNKGMPLEALHYDVTPVGLHYLLVHFDIPALDPLGWRLNVGGNVRRISRRWETTLCRASRSRCASAAQAARGRPAALRGRCFPASNGSGDGCGPPLAPGNQGANAQRATTGSHLAPPTVAVRVLNHRFHLTAAAFRFYNVWRLAGVRGR
jgi:hypothetical protein